MSYYDEDDEEEFFSNPSTPPEPEPEPEPARTQQPEFEEDPDLSGYELTSDSGPALKIGSPSDQIGPEGTERPQKERFVNPITGGFEEEEQGDTPPIDKAKMERGETSAPNMGKTGWGSKDRGMIDYLHSTDAIPPQYADAAREKTAPKGSMPEGDRNLLTLHNLEETMGEDAAHGFMQSLRGSHDVYSALGRAANEKGDYAQAAIAATRAYDATPDGVNARFKPTKEGYQVTFMGPDHKPIGQYALTPKQMDSYLGPAGQFDKKLKEGGPQVIEQLSQEEQEGIKDREWWDKNTKEGRMGISKDLYDYSRQAFPWISQDTKRQEWLLGQRDKETKLKNEGAKSESKVEAAQVKAQGALNVETAKGGWKQAIAGNRDEVMDRATQAKLAGQLAHIAGTNQNALVRAQAEVAGKALSTGNLMGKTNEEIMQQMHSQGINLPSLFKALDEPKGAPAAGAAAPSVQQPSGGKPMVQVEKPEPPDRPGFLKQRNKSTGEWRYVPAQNAR